MRRLAAVFWAGAFACSPAPDPSPPPQPAPPVAAVPPAEPAPPAAAPSAAPSSAPAPAAADPAVAVSEKLAVEIIDRDVMAYSSSEKAFAFRIAYLQEGNGPGLSVDFMGEDGKEREAVRICDPGDCDDHRAERVKEFVPKLGAHFRLGGYVGVEPIRWPDKKKELEIDALGRFYFDKNHLELTRKGRPKSSFPLLVADPAYDIEPRSIGLAPGSRHFVFKTLRNKKPGRSAEFHFLEAGIVYEMP